MIYDFFSFEEVLRGEEIRPDFFRQVFGEENPS
jgi:hypothetical protein